MLSLVGLFSVQVVAADAPSPTAEAQETIASVSEDFGPYFEQGYVSPLLIIALPELDVPVVTSYDASSCVSYVKYRRPDLAFVWGAPKYVEAYPLEPRAGLVVLTTEGPVGHTAYVEAVASGSLIVSEANFLGDFVSTRSLPVDSAVIRGYR